MAIPECAICLDNIGLGDGRATLRGCYHQFCANCILEAVLFYKRIKCPVCKNEIGAVHWGGNSLEVPAPAPQVAPAAAMEADPGPNLYFTSQNVVVHVERIATDMTVDQIAGHFGIATQQIISMNTQRLASENAWPTSVRGSTVMRANTDIWLDLIQV